MFLINFTANAALWVHQSLKEIPVAGAAYMKMEEHIATPLWNLASRATAFSAPHLRNFSSYTATKIQSNPFIAVTIAAGMGFIAARAYFRDRS